MIVENLPLPPVYYHGREASYWREDDAGGWIKINEMAAKNFVANFGYAKKSEGEANSEADDCLINIQSGQNVAYVGALAGFDPGVYEMAGNLILVTKGPRSIQPAPGPWPVLGQLFEGMFVDGSEDQRPYFYGWLKMAMLSFKNRHWRASQLMALVGEKGSGKSITQNLITEMFGGRSRKPYRGMTGGTTFNSELFGGEHLMLEDESAAVDIRSRMHFGSNIKSLLVNRDQSCHGKNQEAITLRPVWRMTLSLNDEPEHLLVLPPLTNDITDKIIALKVYKKPMPMPTDLPDQSEQFWNTLLNELPAFADYLENWAIPPDLADPRYGVVAYQHPEIVEKLGETSPENRLFAMIEEEIYGNQFNREPWTGTAAELERRLLRETSDCREEARKMFAWGGACGTYLGRLEKSQAEYVVGRIASHRVNGVRHYTIQPPQLEPDTPPPNQASVGKLDT
jgi:hypothetical protein